MGFINQVITGGPQKGGKHGKTYSEAWGRFTYKCDFWAKYVVNVVLNIPYMEHMGYKNWCSLWLQSFSIGNSATIWAYHGDFMGIYWRITLQSPNIYIRKTDGFPRNITKTKTSHDWFRGTCDGWSLLLEQQQHIAKPMHWNMMFVPCESCIPCCLFGCGQAHASPCVATHLVPTEL